MKTFLKSLVSILIIALEVGQTWWWAWWCHTQDSQSDWYTTPVVASWVGLTLILVVSLAALWSKEIESIN